MAAKIRSFLAVDTSGTTRRLAASLMATLGKTTAKVNWVDVENLHLTLKFFGDVDEKDVFELARAVERAVVDVEPFSIGFAGLGAFPNERRPRTIWVGVSEGEDELARLHKAIDKAAAGLGFPRERRRFHPHLTLGRVRDSQGLSDLSERLKASAECELGQINVAEIKLYSSQLLRTGPVYTVMARAPIGG